MSLLAPLGLAGLLLLPIIVAIHMWRVRHRRYELSSTLLWSRVLSETPLRRPRQIPTRIILLALQLAVLGCGALALARPSLADAGRHRHLVVALDTSLAMSAIDVHPSRLAHAKSSVRALIDQLNRNDTMTLVDAGPSPRVLADGADHATLQRALAGLSQSYGPSSLAADGPLLGGLLTAAGRGGAAYLFAPPGIPSSTLSVLRRAAPGLAVRVVGASTDDRGVAGLTVACATVAGRPACEAFARLINTSSYAVTARVTASVDSGVLAQTVTLPADADVPIRLSLPTGSRIVSLHVEGHDPLPGDDEAWAVVPLPVHRTALLVTLDATTALAQALRAIPNLTVNMTTPDAYSDDMTRRVDLTILDNTGLSVQPPGNVLAINPGGGWPVGVTGTQQAPGITALRPDDALLRGVDLSSLVIQSSMRATLPAWATSDVHGDGGPLLLSGASDGRRLVVLLFDPRAAASSNASNLDTLLAFPTLLRNAVQALAPPPIPAGTAGAVGAAQLVRQGAAWLQTADGQKVGLASSGDLAALPALRPGIYSVAGGAGGTAASLAVNAVTPGDPAVQHDMLSAAPAPAPPAPALTAPMLAMPWETWAALALLGLLLLSGEWWYYVRHT